MIDTDRIWREAPEREPDRQYYFMEICKGLVGEESAALGRSPTFCVTTFGCQMNARDSEKLSGILAKVGYTEAEEDEADFVIYNTCTVRENANLKVYGHLGRLKHRKKTDGGLRIALCGCMMQEPEVVAKLKESYGFVDLIFGTHNIYMLAELLVRMYTEKGMVIDVRRETKETVEALPTQRKYPFKSGVNIMYGCNNFCTYCIVPYVRGRERSREPQDIVDEVRRLSGDGVTEVMLLGQNVNSYGKNLEGTPTFAALLREVEKVEGIRRIRFMTSHPKDLSDELIETMAGSKKVCRHLHLPLQSGSTRILKRMNRRYTKEGYLELVERIRAAMPDISLTTDIIVGFPGETEEDFEETLDVVRRVGFDNAYTFIYSKRSGTPAAGMENQVPEEVVKKRFERLLFEVQESAKEKAARFAGTVQQVLVEEKDEKRPGFLTGRTSHNLIVHFEGGDRLVGEYVDVELKDCRGFYYDGKISGLR